MIFPKSEATRAEGWSRLLMSLSGMTLLIVAACALMGAAIYLLAPSGHPSPALGPVIIALAATLLLSPIGAITALCSAWINRKSIPAHSRLPLTFLSLHVMTTAIGAWLAHVWGWSPIVLFTAVEKGSVHEFRNFSCILGRIRRKY